MLAVFGRLTIRVFLGTLFLALAKYLQSIGVRLWQRMMILRGAQW